MSNGVSYRINENDRVDNIIPSNPVVGVKIGESDVLEWARFVDGKFGIGIESPLALLHAASEQGLGALDIYVQRASSAHPDAEPAIGGARSRGTLSSPVIVEENDGLGGVGFLGYDGSNFIPAGYIAIKVDGEPGLNDMPGRMEFATTADGEFEGTVRMVIDSAGYIGIGTDPDTTLDVNGQIKIRGGTPGANKVLLSDANGLATWSNTPSLDHGSLNGLGDDDHTQYALLAGRSGGQIQIGGIGTNDSLQLRATSGVGVPGIVGMAFQVGNNGATEAMRILNDGKIGMGIVDPEGVLSFNAAESNIPRIRFQNSHTVSGDAAISNYDDSGGTDLLLGSNLYFDGAGAFTRFDATEESSGIHIRRTGEVRLLTGETGSVADVRLTVIPNGNTGINTIGPDRKLEVLDDTNPQLRLTHTDGSVYTDFQTDGSGNLTIAPSGTNVTIASQIKITGGTPGAGKVLTSNAVGLSTWSDTPPLDHGSLIGLGDDDHTGHPWLLGRSGGQTLIGGTGTTDDLTFRTTSGVGASGADMIFQVGDDGATEAMRILNDGKIGIGISPTGQFEVNGIGNTVLTRITGVVNADVDVLRLGIVTGTASAGLGVTINFDLENAIGSLVNDASVISSFWENPSGGTEIAGLKFSTMDTGTTYERMWITGDGDVGIGTIPAYGLLEIRKDQNATTVLAINNDDNDVSALTELAFYDGSTRKAYLQYNNNVGAFSIVSETGPINIAPASFLNIQSDIVVGGKITRDSGDVELETTTTGDVVIDPVDDVDFLVTVQDAVGAAGGASNLPASPTKYMQVKVGGNEYVIPCFARS